VKRASNLSAVLALILLVAAACSSGSSPGATTSEAAATPTPSPEPSVAASIPPLPSLGEGAGELADILPTEVGGLTIQYQHMAGEEVFGAEEMPPETEAFLDRLNAEPSDISSAFGFAFDAGASDPLAAGGISIVAFRVAGQDEGTLRAAFVEAMETEAGTPVGEEVQVGGKTVTAIGDDETSGYLYVHGDVVFIVGGSPPQLVEEAFAALP